MHCVLGLGKRGTETTRAYLRKRIPIPFIGPFHLQTKKRQGEITKIVISFDKAGEQTARSENGPGKWRILVASH